MSRPPSIEDLLREAAPQVLGAVVRRFHDFADSEDAVQEALMAAELNGRPRQTLDWRTPAEKMVQLLR